MTPAAFFMVLMASVTEGPRLLTSGHTQIVIDYWHAFAAAAVGGVLANFMGAMVIQATSALTLKILNITRCMGVVFIGVAIYGEQCTQLEFIGYLVSLVGLVCYNVVQVWPDIGERIERRVDQALFGRCSARVAEHDPCVETGL